MLITSRFGRESQAQDFFHCKPSYRSSGSQCQVTYWHSSSSSCWCLTVRVVCAAETTFLHHSSEDGVRGHPTGESSLFVLVKPFVVITELFQAFHVCCINWKSHRRISCETSMSAHSQPGLNYPRKTSWPLNSGAAMTREFRGVKKGEASSFLSFETSIISQGIAKSSFLRICVHSPAFPPPKPAVSSHLQELLPLPKCLQTCKPLCSVPQESYRSPILHVHFPFLCLGTCNVDRYL